MPTSSSRPYPISHRPSNVWSPQEDQLLLDARKSGMNWQPIANACFPNKTSNACRKRHERLQERLNAGEWDSVKLEELATAYQEMREEMWSILAARLGEKWMVVEQKCMEKGLKTLSAAARSGKRRNSSDDSGIGLDEAEYRPSSDESRGGRYVDEKLPYVEERQPYVEERMPYAEERQPYNEQKEPYAEERLQYAEEKHSYTQPRPAPPPRAPSSGPSIQSLLLTPLTPQEFTNNKSHQHSNSYPPYPSPTK